MSEGSAPSAEIQSVLRQSGERVWVEPSTLIELDETNDP
jgi:hypothetical protein